MPRLLSLLVAVAILFLGMVTSLPLIREKTMQRQIQMELESTLQAKLNYRTELERRINQVRSDPAVVERLAREKFGLARTGEVVFKFRGDLPPVVVNPSANADVPPPRGR